MAYTNNVPQATQTIAFTQPLIQANFGFLQTGIGVEHNFNAAGTGSDMYHLRVSMPNQADPGSLPAGTNGMAYVNGGNLKFYDGTNISKLTEANITQNGFQWIGRVLVQWGFVTNNLQGTTGTVSFNTTFPAICLYVSGQAYYDGGAVPNGSATVVVESDASFPSTTQFKWKAFTNSGSYTGFYWLAIGR